MASEPDEQRTLPFLQCIQLTGTDGSVVRATGQVDNGAMQNCISKRRWDAYGHCLSALSPTTTRISIANNVEIIPIGRWFGQITICGIGTYSWFEVFESHGAFDVILGKPWLHQLKAIHDYGNDQFRIPQGDTFAVIPNSLLAPSSDSPVQTVSDTTPEPTTELTATLETPAWNQLDREWARIHQIRASKSPWSETRWAVLDIEPMDEDDKLEPVVAEGLHQIEAVTTSAILDSMSQRDLRLKRAGKAQSLWEYEGEIMLAQAICKNTTALRRDQIAQQKRRRKKSQRSKPSERKRQAHALQVSEQRI